MSIFINLTRSQFSYEILLCKSAEDIEETIKKFVGKVEAIFFGISKFIIWDLDKEEIEKFIEYVKSDPRFVIVIKAVGYVNLYYAFLAKDNDELKEIRSKIESQIGKAILQEYKIEVDNMVS